MNERKCQMYIVFGDDEYRSDSNFKNNLEINPYNYFYTKVSSPIDARLFNESFMQEYGKVWNVLKTKNIKVASKIVFIIPNEEYRESVTNLMEQLHYIGDIKVFPKREEKKEIPQEVVNEIKEENPTVLQEKIVEDGVKNQDIKIETEDIIKTKEEVKQEIPKPKTDVPNPYYNPNDNVFYKPHENPNNGVTINPTVATQTPGQNDDDWADLKNAGKSRGKISLALIVFIISFLLLVASIALLFFID